jgi:MFS family permease
VLRQALAADEGVREHPGVLRALRDGRVLYLALVYFLVEMGFYGLTFYLPAQVARLLGTSIGPLVGFVTALPWICALVAVTATPPWCDRHGNSRGVGAMATLVAGLALAVSAVSPPLIAIIALCVAAAGLIVAPALFWPLPTRLLGGAAAAGGIALINSIGNLGGFVAPNLRAWLEIGFHSQSAGLIGLAVGTAIGAACFALAPRKS